MARLYRLQLEPILPYIKQIEVIEEGVIKGKLKALKIQVRSADNFIQIKRIIGESRKIKSQVKKLNSIFEG